VSVGSIYQHITPSLVVSVYCVRSELLPSAATGDIAQLIMEIPQNLWEFLHTR